MKKVASIFVVLVAAMFSFPPIAQAELNAKNVEQEVLKVVKKYASSVSCGAEGFTVFAIESFINVEPYVSEWYEYGVIWADNLACQGGKISHFYLSTVTASSGLFGSRVLVDSTFPPVRLPIYDFEKIVSATPDTIVIHGLVRGENDTHASGPRQKVAITLKFIRDGKTGWTPVKIENRK
ncbi:hypothetical protein FACS189441_4120 [Betaproteobacteria bacterium]|nr:hypothetical protein FACS189441_4120 [Betaproteobacteria bacterium]